MSESTLNIMILIVFSVVMIWGVIYIKHKLPKSHTYFFKKKDELIEDLILELTDETIGLDIAQEEAIEELIKKYVNRKSVENIYKNKK